jgi:tetratricopeptide (TPR) repeat protein
MGGNYLQAITAAKELQEKIPGFYLQMDGPLANYAQYLHQSPLLTMVRFGKWNDILELSVDSLSYASVLQHFARGAAFARTGRLTQAKAELAAMQNAMQNPALKVPLAPFSSAYEGALTGAYILSGVIAEQQNDLATAVSHYKRAVEAEDLLIYNEPRDWLLPARQYLGHALVSAGKYNQAIAVFNKDLEINPRNGWSLTGLAECYKRLKQYNTLASTQKKLKAAWVIKDSNIASAVF